MFLKSLTMEGHLEGMLDRDQRTAKSRLYDNYAQLKSHSKGFVENSPIETNQNMHVSHSAFPRRTSPYSLYLTNKKGHRSSIQRLKHILIVGAYLTVLTIPSSLAAPTNLHMMEDRMKWLNPCGEEQNVEQNSAQSDSDQIASIITEASTALNRAKQFKEEFLQKTFNDKNFDANLKDEHYDWLPALPKRFGGNVSEEHLKTLQLDDVILDAYSNLQRVAVGMEQVVLGQLTHHGNFQQEFSENEKQLLVILCELHTAIKDRGLARRPDIQRDIMDDSLKVYNITSSKSRDWVIYREYMNCLEYIIEACRFLKNQL